MLALCNKSLTPRRSRTTFGSEFFSVGCRITSLRPSRLFPAFQRRGLQQLEISPNVLLLFFQMPTFNSIFQWTNWTAFLLCLLEIKLEMRLALLNMVDNGWMHPIGYCNRAAKTRLQARVDEVHWMTKIKSGLIDLFNSPTLFNLVWTECGASREIKEAIWSLIVLKKIDHQTAQEQFRTNGTFAILSNIYFPIVEFGLFFGLSACIFACVFNSNGRALVMDGRRVAQKTRIFRNRKITASIF